MLCLCIPRTLELGDVGGDGVGGDRSITGGGDNGFRVRVRVRVLSGCPDGPENSSSLNLPLLQYAFSVCIFVPVPRVSAHCGFVVLVSSYWLDFDTAGSLLLYFVLTEM